MRAGKKVRIQFEGEIMKQLLATALLSCACVCAHAQTAEELINNEIGRAHV